MQFSPISSAFFSDEMGDFYLSTYFKISKNEKDNSIRHHDDGCLWN
jgi:hypothetical protein